VASGADKTSYAATNLYLLDDRQKAIGALNKRYEKELNYSSRGRLVRAITRPPFEIGRESKGFFRRLSRAQRHVVRHLRVEVPGWPQWKHPIRIAFLSDFHTGSHDDDLARLSFIVAEATARKPDLALFGGDYVNMQPFGGGRIAPQIIASELARIEAPLGCFAVLGNHDYVYGERPIIKALSEHQISVLDHERTVLCFQNRHIDLIGIPDGDVQRAKGYELLRHLSSDRPALVLVHDPVWFASMPSGPFLMLAGHTHGGQIRLPGLGILRNGSKAPLRWSHGLTNVNGKLLCVTSGIGTSLVPVRVGVPPEFMLLDVVGV
jgi:predicted MPP superfamily phosphohydrolase